MSDSTILLSANSAWNIRHFRSGLLRGLTAAGFRVAIAAPRDPDLDALTDAGFATHALPMSRSGMNPLADSLLLARYVALFRKVRPAAYCGFTIKPNVYGGLAARVVGIPAVHNVSGLGTMFLGSKRRADFALRLYRAAFAKARTVFFQNGEDLRLFVDRNAVRGEQARLLPGSGIDLAHFAADDLPPPDRPTFLFIGRLLRDKGVVEFAEAARLVRQRFPDARFRVAGALDPGNRSAIGAAELKRWVDSGLIDYCGPVDDVRALIGNATAVVLPSYREGLPRVLLEAAAMARPAVASDVPGCRAIVEPGVTGVLCEARSSQSLASALDRMAAMPVEERHAMGRAARRRVERDFDEAIVVDAYIGALREIVGETKR